MLTLSSLLECAIPPQGGNLATTELFCRAHGILTLDVLISPCKKCYLRYKP